MSKTLRADAARNRALLLEAAREVFAEQGIDAPLNEVARRAGVGVATLFRRFPTRDDLVTAAFADRMTANADAVARALDHPDPWAGFCRYVEEAAAMQVGNRGFTDVLTQTFPHVKDFEAERRRTFERFELLVERAKATGRLRQDFSTEDLPMLLMANAGVVSVLGEAAPQAWRRLVATFLVAWCTDPATDAELPPAPTPRQLTRAFARMHVRARRQTSSPQN